MMRSAVSAISFLQLRERDGAGNVDPLAVRLGTGERLDLLHGLLATLGQLLIERDVVALPAQLLFRKLAQHARGDSSDERARRGARLGLLERKRGTDGVFADFCVVVHHAVHADESAAAHNAAMQYGAVP